MKDSTSRLNKQKKKQRNGELVRKWTFSVGVGIFWLAAWYFIYLIVGRDVLIPSPFVVMGRMMELAQDSSFWLDAAHSIVRIGIGLGISLFIGLLGGVLSSVSSLVHHLSKPILTIITATPVVSFIIITLVWFPSTQVVVFITFLMCVPIIWNNTRKGVQSTDPSLIEMSKFYRVATAKRLKLLYIPSLMPYLSAAMSSVFGLAWKVGVAAEVLSHPKWGIGTQLHRSKINLDSESLFAWTAVVVLLSVLFEMFLARLFFQKRRPKKAERIATPSNLYSGDPSIRETLVRPAIHVKNCEVRHLGFQYGGLPILDDFSNLFAGGRVHSLIGPSGSGKTTLLRLLSGILHPDRGEIVWSILDHSPTEIAKEKVSNAETGIEEVAMGYVFQEDRLLPWATVRENLSFVLGRSHLSDFEEDAWIMSILGALKLDGFCDALPSELSGGMRQRVNIARALAVRPSVLFLDEAFKGLDQELKNEVMDLVNRHIKENQTTVFMATHDPSEAKHLESSIYGLEGPPLRLK